MKFELGDVVKLNNDDSPRMTVESAYTPKFLDSPPEEMFRCVWFDTQNRVRRGSFPGKCLVIADQEP